MGCHPVPLTDVRRIAGLDHVSWPQLRPSAMVEPFIPEVIGGITNAFVHSVFSQSAMSAEHKAQPPGRLLRLSPAQTATACPIALQPRNTHHGTRRWAEASPRDSTSSGGGPAQRGDRKSGSSALRSAGLRPRPSRETMMRFYTGQLRFYCLDSFTAYEL